MVVSGVGVPHPGFVREITIPAVNVNTATICRHITLERSNHMI